jgi:hypothetical protein
VNQRSIRIFRLFGTALLLIGVVSALLGPAETHVFYWFEDGGRFHYEGAGFGSLMFANIAIQIAGYYVIAMLCIPLGYGHLKLRWWTPAIMTTLLIAWLIVGLPLSLIALMMLVTSKGVSLVSLPFVTLGFILLYPVIPIMLLRFYRTPSAQRAFRMAESPPSWLSETPGAVKVAVSLMVLLALVLHFPLLFNGFFPLFGHAVFGLTGTLLVDLSIAATVVLVWGISRRHSWSWWVAVVFLALITTSSAATFFTISPHDIVAQMPFAPLEIEALSETPMRGYQLALFVGVIPTATLVVVAVSRRSIIGPGDYSRAV